MTTTTVISAFVLKEVAARDQFDGASHVAVDSFALLITKFRLRSNTAGNDNGATRPKRGGDRQAYVGGTRSTRSTSHASESITRATIK